jgi:hypothetical protein
MALRPFWAFGLALAASSCAGSSDVALDARFAPELGAAPHATVSVLGVLKSGRLSADAWIDLAPSISAPLGSAACPAAFDAALVEKDPTLAKAVDRHARENGVTDALLTAFARGAEGDLILVIETSGQLPTPASKHEETRRAMPAAPTMGMGSGGGGRRGGGGRGAPSPMPPTEEEESKKDALEMSASVFSVKLGRSVGAVTLRYTGDSAADALRRFSEKLGTSLHGARCVGWKTTDRLTAEDIYALHVE